ncbi:MAG: polysulfide reductase NrfD [Deltaproteobacteria bacterium]|nr:polysulfide reductase NrfD [Deltaproteobacteria bacterium]
METGNSFTKRFVMERKPQTIWRAPHALWFFAMGVGGALYLNRALLGIEMGRLWGLSLADLLSLALISVGGLILISDLGQPLRFWRALANPRYSWISVGAICDFVFLFLDVLVILPDLEIGGGRPLAGLPWAGGAFLGTAMEVVAGVAALIVIVYPGLVLSYSPSIPFWNTALIPLQFLAYAFASALGLALIYGATGLAPPASSQTWLLLLGGILALCLLLFVAHLLGAAYTRATARESARLLVSGHLAAPFLGGGLVLGLAVPLLAVLFARPWAGGPPDTVLVLLAGALTLPGNLLSKYGVIRAGIYPPFL